MPADRIFNESQSRAIRITEGSALILAGPGSGKTTVLTHRIAHLVKEKGVDPNTLLVLTFTRAAAREMEERFDLLTEGSYKGIWFGTFHSFFWCVLREELGVRPDRILSEEERLRIFRKLTGYPLTSEEVQEYLHQMEKLKNADIRTKKMLLKAMPELEALCRSYEREKRAQGLLDYEDMAVLCLRLFTEHPEVLLRWQNRFCHIMVDELQDINKEQYQILALLAHTHKNLYAVGDDAQSLYGFRGAEPELIRQLIREFHPQQICLEINYRSTPEIVEAAERLLHCSRKYKKRHIRPARQDHGRVEVISCQDRNEETKVVLELLKKALKAGTPYKEMAVLGRTGISLLSVREALGREKIPVTVTTYHGAKGLEFDLVILIRTNEGVVPDPKSRTEKALEEERRMFYVAVTRARKELLITYTRMRSGKYRIPSRFLRDMGYINEKEG